MTAKRVIGLVLVIAGVVLALEPAWIIEWRGTLPKTESDIINVRATYGGTLFGVGAFLAWLPAGKPRLSGLVALVGFAMAGIAIARLLGFALDGNPDGRQALWLIAELVLVVGCYFGFKRLARANR
jgi:hypothetical protein